MTALRPMRVAHGVLSLDVGGLERIVLSLVRIGRQRGHAVSVICVERPGALAAEAEAAGARVISLGKPPGRRPEFRKHAADTLRELAPNVIHTHQIGAAWYLGGAAKALGEPPLVHTEHGNEFARNPGIWKVVKSRLMFHQTARLIDRFCCVSREVADAVTRWRTVPRAKVEVLPNGVATNPPVNGPSPAEIRATLGIPVSAPVIGTVGRLSEVKRQDLLIRAVAGLRTMYPEVRLLVVGDGAERARLETLAKEMGLTGYAHFVGYQSQPEPYLRAMTVFALTSRSEGFPVSLLEAWLAGVPVVCSAVGGVPAVVEQGQTGLLFPSGDEAELVAALTRLLADAEMRVRLAEAGLRTVRERYSLDSMADEYEERYRQVIAARSGGL